LSFKVSKENVKRVILFSNLLAKFKDKYEVQNSEINFELWPNVFKIHKPAFTSGDFRDLHELEILASKYISVGERFDHNEYLVTGIDGLRWILREDSLVEDADFGLLLANCTEPKEYKWFLEALHENGVFVDVGANVGGYSVRACKMGVEVIAVEPDPDNCRVISSNLEFNHLSNAHLLRIAAGSREEIRQLCYAIDRSPHTYKLEQNEDTLEAKCAVEVKPLDVAIPPFLDDNWINLLKIDVEGFEVEVLEGASNLLKRTRYVIVEVSPATEAKLLKVLYLLRSMGFEPIDKAYTFPGECNIFLRKCNRDLY
jgi:FkbM family methyltransferase